MRCPRKLYLVVSRKAVGNPGESELFFRRDQADRRAAQLNTHYKSMGEAWTDWRVEPYVKGD